MAGPLSLSLSLGLFHRPDGPGPSLLSLDIEHLEGSYEKLEREIQRSLL